MAQDNSSSSSVAQRCQKVGHPCVRARRRPKRDQGPTMEAKSTRHQGSDPSDLGDQIWDAVFTQLEGLISQRISEHQAKKGVRGHPAWSSIWCWHFSTHWGCRTLQSPLVTGNEVPAAPGSTSEGFPRDLHPPIPVLLPCLCPPPGDHQDKDNYSLTDNFLTCTKRVSRHPHEHPHQVKHKHHHLEMPSGEAWYVTSARGFHYHLHVTGEETEAQSVTVTLPVVEASPGRARDRFPAHVLLRIPCGSHHHPFELPQHYGNFTVDF